MYASETYRMKSPGRQKLPTPRELSAQANAISAEKYKWEKYRYLAKFPLECYLHSFISDDVLTQSEHSILGV